MEKNWGWGWRCSEMIKQCVQKRKKVLLPWLAFPAEPSVHVLHAGKFNGDGEKRRMQDWSSIIIIWTRLYLLIPLGINNLV